MRIFPGIKHKFNSIMKKFILSLALFAMLTSCSTGGYQIAGKLTDVTTGVVYLKTIGPMGLVPVDTADVAEGSFKFEGTVEHPELYLLFVDENRVPLAFFLENAKIKIEGAAATFDEATVEGSELSDLFETFNSEVPHQAKVEQMREQFFAAQSSGDEATMQSIIADMETIVAEQQQYYKDFVRNNTENAVGAFLALNMAQALELTELEELVTSFEASLKDHPYVTQLQEALAPLRAQKELEASLEIGKQAPAFNLVDLNGNQVTLEQFRGKYVLVDFWAGWCRSCVTEKPNLVKLYERFGGKDFEIVSVSLDRTEEDWRKAVADNKVSWTNVHDPMGLVAQTYAVQSIPSTWLIDREGNIIRKQALGAELMTVLEGLLN